MVELLVQQGGAGSIVQIELAEAALSKRLSQTLRVYEYTTKVGGGRRQYRFGEPRSHARNRNKPMSRGQCCLK